MSKMVQKSSKMYQNRPQIDQESLKYSTVQEKVFI